MKNTVEEKARNGELPAVKIGRSWVFFRHTLFARLFEMSLEAKRRRRGWIGARAPTSPPKKRRPLLGRRCELEVGGNAAGANLGSPL